MPITVMGFRCERCGHEWIPRIESDGDEPRICPKCKSAYWNQPRKTVTTYEAFCKLVSDVLNKAGHPLTWTEVRTAAALPQAFPNNKWVRRMEVDIGLKRSRDTHGIIHWQLGDKIDSLGADAKAAQTSVKKSARAPRK